LKTTKKSPAGIIPAGVILFSGQRVKSISANGVKLRRRRGSRARGFSTVIGIIDFLTAATSAHSAAKGAEAAAVTAEAQAEVAAGSQKIATNTALIASQMGLATANTAAAGSGAASAVASIPFVGPIMAVAALASVIAAIMAIPKFAEGGIAYGPTLGLFGEYAGASNNPEVVAPLDKLKGLISPGEGFSGHVDFKIKGRDLVGVVRRVLYEELRNGGSGSITRKGGVKRFDD
ncbi:MAG: hypothetical protein IJ156_02960, partial [Bacteroidales bacterium]|nr:hypothetical protein [Bacteroidales bacterium]